MVMGRLWDGIRRWSRFGRTETAAAGEESSAERRSPPPSSRQTGYLNIDAFAGELVRLRDDEAEPPTRLHVFSLSDFRRAVGGKWSRLRMLVEVAVEAIIRRNIDPERDIFTRLDAEIACLALPAASRSETRIRVASIARDIAAHLFGDAVIDGRRPQVVAANLSLDAALTADGAMDRAAIDHALAKAGAALGIGLAGAEQGGFADVALTAPHRATLASLMTPEDVAAVAKEAKTAAVFAISGRDEPGPVAAPDWEAPALNGADAPRETLTLFSALRGADTPRKLLRIMSRLGGADASRTVLTAMSALRGADAPAETFVVSPHRDGADSPAESLPAAARLTGADAERPVLSQAPDRGGAGKAAQAGLRPDSALTLVWTPTWVTSRRAIGAFHARIIRVDSENAPSLEGVDAYRGLAPIEALTLDRFTATQAARELKTLFYSRQKMGLTVPVHWMSLSPKWRDCIRIPFEDCPPEARRKLLKIEVFGLTPAVAPAILRRMFEPLEKIGCDVMARLPLSAVAMIPALSHLRAVGVDLAELPEDERVGDDELFARLEAFRAAARQAKVACYVWGVRRRPLIGRVVAAGFSLVNGPGVMCDLGRPALPLRGASAGG